MLHKYLHKIFKIFTNLYILSWVSVSLQVFCSTASLFKYHFPNCFSPSHFPSISSLPLKFIPSMSTFSFILSLSICQPPSLSSLPIHPAPLLLFSCKPSTVSINGKAVFPLYTTTSVCNLLSKLLLYTPQSTNGTKEMWVMLARWVSPLTDRLSLNIYQGNLALFACKKGVLWCICDLCHTLLDPLRSWTFADRCMCCLLLPRLINLI